MNDQPHTHNVKVATKYSKDGPLMVTYGDTKVYVNRGQGWFWCDRTPKVTDRQIRHAIRRHDRGSVKAGMRERSSRKAQLAQRRDPRTYASFTTGYPEGLAETWPSESG